MGLMSLILKIVIVLVVLFVLWKIWSDLTLRYRAQEAFLSGIQTLDNAATIVCNADISDSTSALEAKKIVQEFSLVINTAHEYLTESLRLWLQENSRLSNKIEKTVQQTGKLKATLSQQKSEIESLNKKLESLQQVVCNKEAELATARRSLESANRTHEESRDELARKKEVRENVRNVGIGISWIPIVGWIAGPAMVIASETALKSAVDIAEEKVKSTRNNVDDCETRISQTRRQESELRQTLSEENENRRDMEEKLETVEKEERALRKRQRTLVIAATKCRNTCHFMTKLWGKHRVLKIESENGYSLEPLFTPLKEIAEMFTLDKQHKLRVTTLLSKKKDFTSMASKLKAICEKSYGDESSAAMLDDYT